jgi:hypothetical protein
MLVNAGFVRMKNRLLKLTKTLYCKPSKRKIKPQDMLILYFSQCGLKARKRSRCGWVKTQPPSSHQGRPKNSFFGTFEKSKLDEYTALGVPLGIQAAIH